MNPSNLISRRSLLAACLAAPALGRLCAAAAPLTSLRSVMPMLESIPGGSCQFEGIWKGALVCRPDAPAGTSGNLWYWFTARLSGARGRQTIELHWPANDPGLESEYDGNQNFATVLDRAINVSADLRHWYPVDDVKVNGQVARFTVDAGKRGAPLFLAVGVPYFAWELEELIAQCRASGLASVTEIARTRNGKPVHAVRIGPAGRSQGAFYLQGYQHGTEWAGARILTSMIRYLLSGEGRRLRERYVFHIVPAMNVGHLYGVDTWGNMNRDWGTFRMAETAGARDYIIRFMRNGDRLLHALDLHMGWYDRASSGAGLTAAPPGAAPAAIIARQEAFARYAFAHCNWTKDQIWLAQHSNGVPMSDWVTSELGVAAQTAEFSRHIVWSCKLKQYIRVTQAHEERLGIDLAMALASFDWTR